MKIVAIGGGEITDAETWRLDQYAVQSTHKDNPSVLFIPTASGDSAGYSETFSKYYENEFGCDVKTLLLSQTPPDAEVDDLINAADMLYVGGGNTRRLLQAWEAYRIGDRIREAAANNPRYVLAGLSAGAICWAAYGSTDSPRFDNPNDARLEIIEGMGLFAPQTLLSPHHVREREAREAAMPQLLSEMGRRGVVGAIGIGIDDIAAYVREDDGTEFAISGQEGRGVTRYDLLPDGSMRSVRLRAQEV